MNQTPSPDSTPPRNMETYKVHRRESIWQIWLPIGMSTAMIVLLVVLVILSEHGDLGQWGAAALILLTIPILIIGLLVLFINLGGVVLFTQGYSHLSPVMLKGQVFLQRVEESASSAADKLVEPFIRVRQLWARILVLRGKQASSND